MDAPFGYPIMESPKPKIERVILILGMGMVILAMICHFFSPIARTLDKQIDLQIAVLSDPPVMLRYHPSSLTADIVQLPENAVEIDGPRGMPGLEKTPQWYVIPPSGDVWPAIKKWLINWRTNPGLIFKYAAFLWKLHSENLTNISLYDLILLALEVPHMDVSDFCIVTAPHTQSGLARRTAATTHSKVTAEVLNATGRRHLAHKVRKFLISNGVDVVYFGNYKQLQVNTMIIDRSGRKSASEEVRGLLGLESIEIHSEPDKTRLADVTVVVGKDFSLPQN